MIEKLPLYKTDENSFLLPEIRILIYTLNPPILCYFAKISHLSHILQKAHTGLPGADPSSDRLRGVADENKLMFGG